MPGADGRLTSRSGLAFVRRLIEEGLKKRGL
jgi:hypothetical protein